MHNSVNKCYGQGCWLCRGWHSCCHGLMERSSHALCEKISHNLAVIQCISHKLELVVRDAVKHITKHSYFHIFNDFNVFDFCKGSSACLPLWQEICTWG